MLLPVGIGIHVTEGGLGIELAVQPDQILSCRDSVYLIGKVIEQIPVGICIRHFRGISLCIDIIIVCGKVISFIILPWISDDIVCPESPGVPAPFGIDVHYRIPSLRLLCGDHDHAVGASCPIKGIGSRVLQDSH